MKERLSNVVALYSYVQREKQHCERPAASLRSAYSYMSPRQCSARAGGLTYGGGLELRLNNFFLTYIVGREDELHGILSGKKALE
jgi:hypothetical protein